MYNIRAPLLARFSGLAVEVCGQVAFNQFGRTQEWKRVRVLCWYEVYI